MQGIAKILSKSIKEGKWLLIRYTNQEEKSTEYWCSIIDINLDSKKLQIKMFNKFYNLDIIDTWINFERITSAQILEGTCYEVPESLITKINDNLSRLDWLEYTISHESVLSYLMECYQYDCDPYQKNFDLVIGIDKHVFNNGNYNLNNEQYGIIVDKILKLNTNEFNNRHFFEIILNILSIAISDKLYIVAYKRIWLY